MDAGRRVLLLRSRHLRLVVPAGRTIGGVDQTRLHRAVGDRKTLSGRLGAGAIDIGCGIGDYSRLLAEHGFDVCGVDLSPVAIDRARHGSDSDSGNPRFVVADLLELPDEVEGPFDLLVDIGTLDDFPRRKRPQAAAVITSLAHTGSKLYLWCFFGRDDELPAVSFDGASRYLAPGEPRELDAPFGTHWEIEPAATGDRWASFLLTHR